MLLRYPPTGGKLSGSSTARAVGEVFAVFAAEDRRPVLGVVQESVSIAPRQRAETLVQDSSYCARAHVQVLKIELRIIVGVETSSACK